MNCRICLNKYEHSITILSSKDERSLMQLVPKYLHLKIEPDDLYSTNVCPSCTENLQRFHDFYQNFLKWQANHFSAETAATDPSEDELILKTKSVLEKNKSCRLCFVKCENAEQLLTESKENICTQIIEKYLCLQIETDNDYATITCANCTKSLLEFHNFYQCIEKCQLTLKPMQVPACDSSKRALILKKETKKQISEDDIDERAIFETDTTVIKHEVDEAQSMDQCFLGITVKTEYLSANEKSDISEYEEFLEDNKPMMFCNTVEPETDCKNPTKVESAVTVDIKKRTCAVCSKVFNTNNNLRHHMHIQHNKKQVPVEDRTCSICSKVFGKVKTLKTHMLYKHNPKNEDISNRTCNLCCKVYSTAYALRKHESDQHSKKPINQEAIEDRTCRVCFKVYDTIKALKAHMNNKHNPKDENASNRTCNLCSTVLSTVYLLKRHMRLQHDEAIEHRACRICSIVYDTAEKLREHMNAKHNPKDISNRTCCICFKVFKTAPCLKQHMRIQHNEMQETLEHRTCRMCSAVLSTVYGLKRHMRLKHSKKEEMDKHRTTCRVCLKVFDQITELDSHMSKEHEKVKRDFTIKDEKAHSTKAIEKNGETIKCTNKIKKKDNEIKYTEDAKWSADLQIKVEEPLEIEEFLDQ